MKKCLCDVFCAMVIFFTVGFVAAIPLAFKVGVIVVTAWVVLNSLMYFFPGLL